MVPDIDEPWAYVKPDSKAWEIVQPVLFGKLCGMIYLKKSSQGHLFFSVIMGISWNFRVLLYNRNRTWDWQTLKALGFFSCEKLLVSKKNKKPFLANGLLDLINEDEVH